MVPSTDSPPYAGPERRRYAPDQRGNQELDLVLEGSGIGIWELELTDPWITENVTFADLLSHRCGLPEAAGA